MAFVGGAFGIGFGKLIFGGLGQNPFNPALLGRAFLQAAFPAALTSWPANTGADGTVFSHFRLDRLGEWAALRGDNFAWPLMHADVVDGTTSATPLGLWKFQATGSEISSLLLGNTGGCIGETAGLLILLCGGYLVLRNHLNWRIPVSIFATVAALSLVFQQIDADAFSGPLFMLFSGGPDARRRLHGHRHGDLAGDAQGLLDLRPRHRRPGGRHPRTGAGSRRASSTRSCS